MGILAWFTTRLKSALNSIAEHVAQATTKMESTMNSIAEYVAQATTKMVHHRFYAKIEYFIIFLSPAMFLPTIWEAYTAPNIDALKTVTWPAAVTTNLFAFIALAHKGSNVLRWQMLVWIVEMVAMCIAIVIR